MIKEELRTENGELGFSIAEYRIKRVFCDRCKNEINGSYHKIASFFMDERNKEIPDKNELKFDICNECFEHRILSIIEEKNTIRVNINYPNTRIEDLRCEVINCKEKANYQFIYTCENDNAIRFIRYYCEKHQKEYIKHPHLHEMYKKEDNKWILMKKENKYEKDN